MTAMLCAFGLEGMGNYKLITVRVSTTMQSSFLISYTAATLLCQLLLKRRYYNSLQTRGISNYMSTQRYAPGGCPCVIWKTP